MVSLCGYEQTHRCGFQQSPTVVLTSDSNLDPTILDSEYDPDVDWQDAQEIFDPLFVILGIIFAIMLLSWMPSAAPSSKQTLMHGGWLNL